jgi:hypothetical protein
VRTTFVARHIRARLLRRSSTDALLGGAIAPQADHVRLGFEHGVRLTDPDGILEPMGKQVRFVRAIPGRALPTAGIARMIQQALRTLPAGRDAPRRTKPKR